MKQIVVSYLEGLRFGEPQNHENLVMVPLLSEYDDGLGYLTLAEALASGRIEIREVSESGSVPELRVVSRGDSMVLILDGEELVGAKQNRIVNTTILVPARSELVIPVSCVEQGRWAYRGKRFETRHRVLNPRARRIKAKTVLGSLRIDGAFEADQGAIWAGVEQLATVHQAVSPSMDLDYVYEKKAPVLEEYAKRITPCENQIGAAFFAGGRLLGVDAFGRAATLRKVFKSLVESYALDALGAEKEKKPAEAVTDKVKALLQEAKSASFEQRPAVGVGTDLRLETGNLTGFALEHQGKLVHLVIFPGAESGEFVESGFILRPSLRRRRRWNL